MDSKTLTTLLIVVIGVLLLPVCFGIIGGIFGIFGSILGGIFGLIGGLFGAVFGFIGGVFGAIMGFFGWLIGAPFHWHWPGSFFDNRDAFTIILVILVVVLVARSKAARTGK